MSTDEQGPEVTDCFRQSIIDERCRGRDDWFCIEEDLRAALAAARTERDTALAELRRSTAEASRLRLAHTNCESNADDWRGQLHRAYEYRVAAEAELSAVQAAVVTARRDAWDEGQIREAFMARGEWWTDRHWDDFVAELRARASTQTPAEPDVHTVAEWMTRMHYYARDTNDTAGRCVCGLPEVNELHGPAWKPTPSAEEQLAARRADTAFTGRLVRQVAEDRELLDRIAAGEASTQTPAAGGDDA